MLIDDDGHVYLSDFGLAKAALATRGPTTADHWVGHARLRRAGADPRRDGRRPDRRLRAGRRRCTSCSRGSRRSSGTATRPSSGRTSTTRRRGRRPRRACRWPSTRSSPGRWPRSRPTGTRPRASWGATRWRPSRGDDVTAMTVIARRPLAPKGARRWRGVAALGAAAAVGAVAALLLTGDPAPEGSEPPTAEASPTATPEPPPETSRRAGAARSVDDQDARATGPRSWSIAAGTSGSSRAAGRTPVRFDLKTASGRPTPRARPRRDRRSSADRGTVWIAYKPQNRVVHLDARTGALSRRDRHRRSGRPRSPSAPPGSGSRPRTAATIPRTSCATRGRRDAARQHARSTTASRTWSTARARCGWRSRTRATIRRYSADGRWRVATGLAAARRHRPRVGRGALWALSGGRHPHALRPRTTTDGSTRMLPGLPGAGRHQRRARRRRRCPPQDRLFLVDARTIEARSEAVRRRAAATRTASRLVGATSTSRPRTPMRSFSYRALSERCGASGVRA